MGGGGREHRGSVIGSSDVLSVRNLKRAPVPERELLIQLTMKKKSETKRVRQEEREP